MENNTGIRQIELSHKYEILEKLGEGGMGAVMKATSMLVNEETIVAIKIFDKEDMPSEDALERFYRESELLRIANHPNISDYIDFGETESFAYLVMEYVEGDTFDDYVASQGGTLHPDPVISIMMDILEALIYMNEEHNMSHRDLKPANIMVKTIQIDGKDRLKGVLVDFGNTKITESKEGDSLTRMSGMMSGTPGYTAPGVTVDIYDERDDVFSLAATVIFALLGKNPFEVEDDMQASMFNIIKGDIDLGKYEGTAIGQWIRINVVPPSEERLSLRESYNALRRIKDNPLKEVSLKYIKTIANDDVLVDISEKVEALQKADNANEASATLQELGFEASWMSEAFDDAEVEPSDESDISNPNISNNDLPKSSGKRGNTSPELAIIDGIMKKQEKKEEPSKEAELNNNEIEKKRTKSAIIILILFLLVLLESFSIAFLLFKKKNNKAKRNAAVEQIKKSDSKRLKYKKVSKLKPAKEDLKHENLHKIKKTIKKESMKPEKKNAEVKIEQKDLNSAKPDKIDEKTKELIKSFKTYKSTTRIYKIFKKRSGKRKIFKEADTLYDYAMKSNDRTALEQSNIRYTAIWRRSDKVGVSEEKYKFITERLYNLNCKLGNKAKARSYKRFYTKKLGGTKTLEKCN